jgi:hypothetical protein
MTDAQGTTSVTGTVQGMACLEHQRKILSERYSSRYYMPETTKDEYSNQYSAGHVMTDAQGTTSVTGTLQGMACLEHQRKILSEGYSSRYYMPETTKDEFSNQ